MNILVAVDLGESSEFLVKNSRSRFSEAHVLLVHVVPPITEGIALDFMPALPVDFEVKLEREAKKRLVKLADEVGLDHEHVVVSFGDPKETLRHLSVNHEADIVVIGAHRHRGVERLLGVTTGKGLVGLLECDLYVVHL